MSLTVKKIGFIVNNCGPNQIAYQLITSINEWLRSNDKVDPCIFYHNMSHFVEKPSFGVFGLFEAFSYDGVMVATSLHSLQRCLSWPGPNRSEKIYLYCMDLEWVHIPAKQWEHLNLLYNHPKVELIARSKPHAEIISAMWRPPVGIVENASFAGFVDLCLNREALLV